METLTRDNRQAHPNTTVRDFSSVILLTDFSETAKNAIKYAIDAFGTDVKYKLVNAYYARTSSATLLDLNDMLLKDSEQGLAEELKWIKQQYPFLKLEIEARSVFGNPVDAIEKIAKDEFQDLVIMGTKGASGIDAVLFGSTASSVIRNTIVPVISVPPLFSYNGFKKVVFSTDGSTDFKKKAIDPLVKIQNKFNSEITVVTIENKGKAIDLSAMDLPLEIDKYANLQDSNVALAVTEYCADEQADLMVVLPKHHGFFERMFHKSISKELVELASMPILSLEND